MPAGIDMDMAIRALTGYACWRPGYQRSGSSLAGRTAGGELLAHPGAELADDGVFVRLATKQQELREVGDYQARNRPADGAHRVPAIISEQVTDQGLAVPAPDLGDT